MDARPDNVAAKYVGLEIAWTCGNCYAGNRTDFDLGDIRGGCSCGPDDDYCYCPNQEVVKHVDCVNCKTQNEVRA